MIRLVLLACGLAIYLGGRVLAGRRRVVRLRDGRRVRLLSSVALLGGSATDLLALEYVSSLPEHDTEGLRLEALDLVRTVGARKEYGPCRTAVVTARKRRNGGGAGASPGAEFTFHRSEPGAEWVPAGDTPGRA